MTLSSSVQIGLAPALTVITCTHNPRPEYLRETVAALRAQTLPRKQWEYVLIDNASAPDRGPDVDLSWHEEARLIREDQPGLTAARLRGIREAKGNLLVFVDDDNVLNVRFLETALDIANRLPQIGSYSGQCHPRFEVVPASDTRPYWGNLVIREFAVDRWSNLPHLADTMPCGAGLCVRRQVARHYLWLHESGARPVMLDRNGKSLMSGGDNDLAACACDIGLGVGLFSRLELEHLISRDRVQREYLVRLVEGISYSGIIFRSFRGERHAEGRRWASELADFLRRLRMTGLQRQIHRAWRRGEKRGANFVNATGRRV